MLLLRRGRRLLTREFYVHVFATCAACWYVALVWAWRRGRVALSSWHDFARNEVALHAAEVAQLPETCKGFGVQRYILPWST